MKSRLSLAILVAFVMAITLPLFAYAQGTPAGQTPASSEQAKPETGKMEKKEHAKAEKKEHKKHMKHMKKKEKKAATTEEQKEEAK